MPLALSIQVRFYMRRNRVQPFLQTGTAFETRVKHRGCLSGMSVTKTRAEVVSGIKTLTANLEERGARAVARGSLPPSMPARRRRGKCIPRSRDWRRREREAVVLRPEDTLLPLLVVGPSTWRRNAQDDLDSSWFLCCSNKGYADITSRTLGL